MAASPVQAQRIISTASDLAAQALAVRESVNRRPRPEYQPIGAPLGQLFRDLDIYRLPWISDKGFTGTPAPAPTKLAPDEPAYAPLGPDTGSDSWTDSLLLHPHFDLSLEHDDNVLRSANNERDDEMARFVPRLDVASDWQNHGLYFFALADLGRYRDLSTENYTDFRARLEPRLDITEHHRLNLGFGASTVHVARGSTDGSLEGPEPARNNIGDISADWHYKADRYSSRLLYRFQRVNAKNNDTIKRDQLDRDVDEISWRNAYEFAPGSSAWVRPEYSVSEFRLSADDNDFNRDNHGWSLLFGLTQDASAVAYLDIGIGYLFRTFDQPGIDDFDSIAGEARVLWNATNLTTFELAAGRTARIVESQTSSASIDDSITLKAAWDPRENLIIDASLGYTDSDFRTLPGSSRREKYLEGQLGVQYLLNEYVEIQLAYEYSDLNSNIDSDDFKANVFSLRIKIGL